MDDVQIGQAASRGVEPSTRNAAELLTPARATRAIGLGAVAFGALALGATAIGHSPSDVSPLAHLS